MTQCFCSKSAITRPLHCLVVALFLAATWMALACPANAQGSPGQTISDETATPIAGAGHDHIHLLGETVNLSNGSVSRHISLPTPRGRGISVPYEYVYNSAGLYHLGTDSYGAEKFLPSHQTLDNTPHVSWSESTFTPPQDPPPAPTPVQCNFATSFTFTDFSGSSHNLGLGIVNKNIQTTGPNDHCQAGETTVPPAGCSPACGGPFDGKVWSTFTTPSDSLSNVGNWSTCTTCDPPATGQVGAFTVTDENGLTYFFAGYCFYDSVDRVCKDTPIKIEDRNGNFVTASTGLYTDTLGRNLKGTNQSGQVTIGGLAYPAPVLSGPASVTVNYTPVSTWTITTGQGEGLLCPWGIPGSSMTVSGTQPATGGLALPNSTVQNPQQYTFYYGTYNPNDATLANVYGLLNEIVHPDGGWVKYKWAMSSTFPNDTYTEMATFTGIGLTTHKSYPNSCFQRYATPVLVSRQVSYDGVNPALTQTFSYSTTWPGTSIGDWTAKTTTVSTTDNTTGKTSQTVYTYTPSFAPGFSPLVWGGVATQIPVEHTIVYYDWDNTTSPLRTVTKNWYNAFLLSEEDTTENGQTSKVTYSYTGGVCVGSGCSASSMFPVRLSEKDEYDYGQSTPARTTSYQYKTFAVGPLGLPVPPQPSVITVKNSAGTSVAETDYSYDDFSLASMTNVVQHDDVAYGTTLTNRANLTTVTKKCFPLPPATATCTDATTTYHYDMTGQPASMTDPNGNTTQYFFTDSPSGGNTGGQSNAYLTKVVHPVTNNQETFSYNYVLGDLVTSTDQNNQATNYQYVDPFDRLTETDFPDGGKTTNSYDSQLKTTTASQLITSSLTKTSAAIRDGLFHVAQTQLTSDSDVDNVDITYDGLGRKRTVTNPHRSSSSPTDGTTTTSSDALGRPKVTTQPDGSTVQMSYTDTCASLVNTAATTVVDEAGFQRRSCSDGLGRLVEVDEPQPLTGSLSNPLVTLYSYDALGNLTCVEQHGGTTGTGCSSPPSSDATSPWRVRRFTYNSLAQLLSATNPESGTISYTYDNNGNVATKTAPKANQTGSATVVTTYTYDVTNRLKQKSYNDGTTATVKYGYDGIAISGCTTPPPTLTDSYPKPHRTAMCDGSGATSWSHDQMGRILFEKRQIGSVTAKTTGYQYNLDGSLAKLNYPGTGKMITYTYNGAGRVLTAKDVNSGISYATSATYAAFGGLMSMNLGAQPISISDSYNSRLQPVTLAASTAAATIMSLTYDFHFGTGDNGNVFQIVNNRVTTRTQNFSYDGLNRIQQASTASSNWGEQYTIDAWGNLTNIGTVSGKNPGETLNCATTAVKNQLNTCYSYDAAGNMIQNGSATYTYDGENRLVTTAGYTYTYDGDGNRVKKANGSAGTLYWRGPGGDPIAESSLTGTMLEEYIFVSGKRVARRDVSTNTVHYYLSDHLGSTSLITSAVGVIQEESDYYPYGGEIAITNGDPNNYKFTGKERDSESGLDNFGARFDASSIGRFMTPDWAAKPVTVPYANFGNPQSLNLYSYVENNPTTLGDPDGHGDDKIVCGEGAVFGKGLSASTSSGSGQCQQTMAAAQKNWHLQLRIPQHIAGNVTLPSDPSKLGPEWVVDPLNKSPNRDSYVRGDGTKLDFDRGQKGKPGWRGKDHWHVTKPGETDYDKSLGSRGHITPGTDVGLPDFAPKYQPSPPVPNELLPTCNACEDEYQFERPFIPGFTPLPDGPAVGPLPASEPLVFPLRVAPI